MNTLLRVVVGCCLALSVRGLTIDTLNMDITNSSCGTERACFSEPVSCNPATDSGCLFVSTMSSGGGLNFQLAGTSSGYIAVALSTDANAGGNDNTYICSNSSGSANFSFALLNNDQLVVQSDTSSISNVSISLNGTLIQCVFGVTGLNASASRTAHNTFAVVLAEGTVNADGSFASPTIRTTTALVDLTNPASTNAATSTTNTTDTTVSPSNATTASPDSTTTSSNNTTTSGTDISLRQSLSQALLIIFGVLAIGLL